MDHGLPVFVFWIPQIPRASEVGMRRLRSHPRCFTANYQCWRKKKKYGEIRLWDAS